MARKWVDDVIRRDEYVDICPNCGGLFPTNWSGRIKIFCSNRCRSEWNRKHPNENIERDLTRTVICKNCGMPFHPNVTGRTKRFCSDRCRLAWNHKHPQKQNWKDTSRQVVCPVCGKEFIASREYGRLRKYCGHACANKAREMGRRGCNSV
ncbi:MAG: hypothetical protein IIZ54_00465 [Selenomonadaceae bacterium]|nr:hypothetical protein [Selenomonadaceae bacterium]